VQRAVEQPSAAVHPQKAAAVITEAQVGIPEIPAALPEDRPERKKSLRFAANITGAS